MRANRQDSDFLASFLGLWTVAACWRRWDKNCKYELATKPPLHPYPAGQVHVL